jgi:hypothetical protein
MGDENLAYIYEYFSVILSEFSRTVLGSFHLHRAESALNYTHIFVDAEIY